MPRSEVVQKNTEVSPIFWSNATKETDNQKLKRKPTYERETLSRKKVYFDRAAHFTVTEEVTPLDMNLIWKNRSIHVSSPANILA